MGVISGSKSSVRDIQLSKMVQSVAGWTAAGDATSVLTSLDRSGGGLSFATDGTDNDCSVWYREHGEIFDFGDVGCRCVMEAKVAFNQDDSNPGNMFIGFTDTLDNTTIGDSDTLASQDAIGFWVVGGSAFWRTAATNASADSGATSTTACVDATEYKLRIEVEGLTGGLTIRYYVDDVLINTVTNFSYTNFGPELEFGIAVANKGAAANTLSVYELDISHRAMS